MFYIINADSAYNKGFFFFYMKMEQNKKPYQHKKQSPEFMATYMGF